MGTKTSRASLFRNGLWLWPIIFYVEALAARKSNRYFFVRPKYMSVPDGYPLPKGETIALHWIEILFISLLSTAAVLSIVRFIRRRLTNED